MSALMLNQGMLPGKYSTNLMQWNRGVCGDSGGSQCIEFGTEAYTDLTQVGVLAPTTAWFQANTPSITPPNLSVYGNIYIGGKDSDFSLNSPIPIQYFAIKQISSGIVAVIASQAISYGDVIMPTGWQAVGCSDTAIRKLHFAHNYRSDWGGIPNFGVDCTGGEVLFTDSEDAGIWAIAYGLQTFSAWQYISLADYLPDAARIVRLRSEVRYIDGSSGSAYIRASGPQNSTGQGIGSAYPNSVPAKDRPIFQLDSQRGFEIKTTGNARAYLYLEAYRTTDPC